MKFFKNFTDWYFVFQKRRADAKAERLAKQDVRKKLEITQRLENEKIKEAVKTAKLDEQLKRKKAKADAKAEKARKEFDEELKEEREEAYLKAEKERIKQESKTAQLEEKEKRKKLRAEKGKSFWWVWAIIASTIIVPATLWYFKADEPEQTTNMPKSGASSDKTEKGGGKLKVEKTDILIFSSDTVWRLDNPESGYWEIVEKDDSVEAVFCGFKTFYMLKDDSGVIKSFDDTARTTSTSDVLLYPDGSIPVHIVLRLKSMDHQKKRVAIKYWLYL